MALCSAQIARGRERTTAANRWPARLGLERLAALSAYAGILLWIVSGFLASRTGAANPTCSFPASGFSCMPSNTMLDGALATGIAGTLLVVGAVVTDGWAKSAKQAGRISTARRARATMALVAFAIALFLAVAVLAFFLPPQRAYRLNGPELNPAWVTYTTVEGSATIQAYAGDVLHGYGTVQWFNRSAGYVGVTGPGAYIVPFGDPLSPGLNDLGNGYPVPRDGQYTVFALGTPCALVPCPGNPSQNFTAALWINITGTNPTVLPTAQLGIAGTGAGVYVAALFVAWERPKRTPPPE